MECPHNISVIKIFYLIILFHMITGNAPEDEKTEFCNSLDCDDSDNEKVCGVRYEDQEVTFRLFDSQCQLLRYGCQVEDSKTFGMINMKFCNEASKTTPSPEVIEHVKFMENCPETCANVPIEVVCAIRQEGEGFKIRTFDNKCKLSKHNCMNDLQFVVTDNFICENNNIDEENEIPDEEEPVKNNITSTSNKNLVIVDGSMFDRKNINQSIHNFFAATHVLDLPLKDVQPAINETTRRMLVKVFGPIKVFKPWVIIPKNKSDDYDHRPTLSSCYHKCPKKCPDTYAPVCGVPGTVAREPSLVFQNHCYMDVAQCKMQWEGKSYTAETSFYIESSFLFCLGDELNALYRFLPLVKTLQHMGRLKNKARFKYKLRNMRFFNQLLDGNPRIMG